MSVDQHQYTGPERRLITQERILELEQQMQAQLEAGSKRMDAIEKKLDDNTATTARVETNTTEMLEFFNSVKGAFKVLDMLGKLAKPLAYILMLIGAITAFWLTLKNGGKVHE